MGEYLETHKMIQTMRQRCEMKEGNDYGFKHLQHGARMALPKRTAKGCLLRQKARCYCGGWDVGRGIPLHTSPSAHSIHRLGKGGFRLENDSFKGSNRQLPLC